MKENVFCDKSSNPCVTVKLAHRAEEFKFYDAHFVFDNNNELFFIKSIDDEQLFLVAHPVSVQYIYIQLETIFKGEENEKDF